MLDIENRLIPYIPRYMYRSLRKRFPLASLIHPYNRSTAPTLVPIYMCLPDMRYTDSRPVPYIQRHILRHSNPKLVNYHLENFCLRDRLFLHQRNTIHPPHIVASCTLDAICLHPNKSQSHFLCKAGQQYMIL